MNMKPAIIAAALILLFGAPGCKSWFTSAQWEEMGTEYDVDFAIVWDAVKLTLIDEFGALEFERPAEGLVVTGWQEHLSFMAGQGFREQAHVQVVKGEKGYKVLVRVATETNEEPIHTLDPRYARWEASEDRPGKAQRIVGLVHIRLQAVIDT
jgi:hypothetical protein